MSRAPSSILCAALLAVLTACSSPNPRYYTLGAPAPAAPAAATTRTVAVGPVTVPARVDRPQLVISEGAHQVRIDEFSRWAEPLADGIGAALVAQLALRLPGTLVRSWGEGGVGDPGAVQVRIDVQRFDIVPGDHVRVELLWTVLAPGAAPRTGISVVSEPSPEGGVEAAVAAHSRALQRASADIAAAIGQP